MIHESVTYIQIGCIILIKFIEGLEGDKRSWMVFSHHWIDISGENSHRWGGWVVVGGL